MGDLADLADLGDLRDLGILENLNTRIIDPLFATSRPGATWKACLDRLAVIFLDLPGVIIRGWAHGNGPIREAF